MLTDIIKKYMVRKPVILSSGKKSDLYFDLKSMLLDPMGAYLVGLKLDDYITKNINPNKSSLFVGGLELGAAILAPIMSLRGYNTFILRKNQKDHGLQTRWIGQHPDKFKQILILDDVMTTGSSIRECLTYIVNEFDIVANYRHLCIIDRSEDARFTSLFKESEFNGI